jgi:hypothetical protein
MKTGAAVPGVAPRARPDLALAHAEAPAEAEKKR